MLKSIITDTKPQLDYLLMTDNLTKTIRRYKKQDEALKEATLYAVAHDVDVVLVERFINPLKVVKVKHLNDSSH